jgi:membrane-associated protein
VDVIAAAVLQLPTLDEIVVWGGYLGLCGIVFAETGLLVGFFLPGDSLLVTAGLFAAKGDLDILLLNVLLIPAAIAGDATGFLVGVKAGRPLYDRPQSRFFRRDHLLKAKEFYEKYGGVTIFIARFMPFVRTFVPVVAGIAELTYRRFATFNIPGNTVWIVSMTLTGYFLGSLIPGIEQKIEYVIAAVIFLSVLPLIIRYLRQRREKQNPVT